MDYPSGGGAWQHPNHVEIPDAATEGMRRYREPDQPHPLQLAFLEPEGEAAYVAGVRDLLVAGRFDEAAAKLEADLSGFEGRTARIALACRPEEIAIEGWDDLADILAEYEGPPITCITAGLANDPDLVFAPGADHEPDLMFNLYSDDEFDFTAQDDAALLAACEDECPGWIGHEEDVEFYVGIEGLAALNSALVQCRHRNYLRDGHEDVEGRAPGGYVEYVLACWLRCTRFLQAIARAIDAHGLPEGVRLVVGTVGLNTDLATLLGTRAGPAPREAAGPAMASLTLGNWERGQALEEEPPAAPSGSSLRQRIDGASALASPPVASENEPAPTPPVTERRDARRFFAKLFGS